MYDQYYGFKGRPFQLTPDPHFYYESATHRKALSYLGYGMAQGEGFIVITGDIGAGKTTLVAHIMATIDPARLTAVKIVSTQVEGDDLLRLVAQQFGITGEALPKAQLLQRIEAFLHAQARKGLRTLLIVDEAQGLPVSALEELRMLSNFQLGGQALLQIFLLGQPEFRDLLKSPELEQLRQRVIATHHLDPMQANEVEPYIRHRLSLVGWTGNPDITSEAISAVYAATDGVPRRVNALMSRVMLLGAVDHLSRIDGQAIEAVAADMGLEGAVATAPAQPSPLDNVVEEPEAHMSPAFAPIEEEGFTLEPEKDAPAVATEPVTAIILEQMEADARAQDSRPAGNGQGEEAQDLHRIRDELDEMRAMISLTGDRGDLQRELAERLDAIETRVNAVEMRGDDQEAALRRVLTLLVDWVENEERNVRAA